MDSAVPSTHTSGNQNSTKLTPAYYSNNTRFLVSVDVIVFGYQERTLKVLLLQRDFEPYCGRLSLLGGFVREDESVDEAAQRVMQDLTGLSENYYLSQVGVFGDVKRDTAARVITCAYYALVNIDNCSKEMRLANQGYWERVDHLPPLIFDHADILQKAMTILRNKISNVPIGFNLLKERFTLRQLQDLYESILGEPIDKRNFRKRVAEMPFIVKTEEKDRKGSRRGAFLYTFNQEHYEKIKKFKL